ncbi:hypothetical protein E2C01_037468 [Portunus trituberculatus]|uniref:Uncharacterized protein n=1 Tax=Portunus trituberculatus TaxID=210409 RepID=A0A5B7FH61_PORTR|nr:hypothetical protein [Portunus trituberculatus]
MKESLGFGVPWSRDNCVTIHSTAHAYRISSADLVPIILTKHSDGDEETDWKKNKKIEVSKQV